MAGQTEKVTSSTTLWSTVVKEADSSEEERPSYEFSNGRRYVDPKR